MRSVMSLAVVLLVAGGCYSPEGYRLNVETGAIDHGPTEEEVFEAAKQEILERYPEAAVSEQSNLISALSPIELRGSSKTRKQVTVWVRELYTGAWEPTVRVVLHAEVAEPIMGTDPESTTPLGANPVAENDWVPLQHLTSEEEAIRDGIWRKVYGTPPETTEEEADNRA